MENKKTIEISANRILGLLALITSLISLLGLAVSNSDSTSFAVFWVLIIYFCIPSFVYIITCSRSVVRGGIKYLVFRERKIIVETVKVEVNEAEVEKQKIKNSELIRQQRENYSISKLKTRWMAAPLLMGLGAGIYAAIVYFSNGKEYIFDSFNTAILIIGALGILNVWGLSLQYDWEDKLKIKGEIYEENPEYKFYSEYDDDFIYTDSKFSYLSFRLAKILAYILGLAGIAILAGILISYVSGISISPTTIIIFLLVMIYFEVKKRNQN